MCFKSTGDKTAMNTSKNKTKNNVKKSCILSFSSQKKSKIKFQNTY